MSARTVCQCRAVAGELSRVMSFVRDSATSLGLEPPVAHAVRLAVEEVFTNISTHGHREGDPGPVEVTIESRPDAVVVTVSDRAVAFDPDRAPAPDLDADWEDRPLGGLGWHLVREVMDEVRHRPRPGGGNVTTLVKRRDVP